jgi:hypothetical protein
MESAGVSNNSEGRSIGRVRDGAQYVVEGVDRLERRD